MVRKTYCHGSIDCTLAQHDQAMRQAKIIALRGEGLYGGCNEQQIVIETEEEQQNMGMRA